MNSNRFAPPEAPVADLSRHAHRKPKAAWLLQLVMGSFGCFVAFTVLQTLFFILVAPRHNWVAIGVGLLVKSMLLAMVVYGVVGTQRRAACGRWLGLLFIALLVALIAYASWHTVQEPPPSAGSSAEAIGYRTGQSMGLGAMLLALVFWFRSFGFSSAAVAYWRRAGVVTPDLGA